MKYSYQTEFNEIMKKYKKTNKFKEVSLLSELIQILENRLIEQSTEFIDYSKFDTTILKKYFDSKKYDYSRCLSKTDIIELLEIVYEPISCG